MQGSKAAAPGVVFKHTSQGDAAAANNPGGILMVDRVKDSEFSAAHGCHKS